MLICAKHCYRFLAGINSINTRPLRDRYNYYLNFTHEETETQNNEVLCLMTPST